jgi:uncharacterized membrane protein
MSLTRIPRSCLFDAKAQLLYTEFKFSNYSTKLQASKQYSCGSNILVYIYVNLCLLILIFCYVFLPLFYKIQWQKKKNADASNENLQSQKLNNVMS